MGESDEALECALSSATVPVNYLLEARDGIGWGSRRRVVEFIAKVCEYFELGAFVAGRAVLYMDRYLSHIRVVKEELTRIALACIAIACKHMECERIPSFATLCATLQTPTPARDLVVVERKILTALDWKLNTWCAQEFVLDFIRRAPQDLTRTGGQVLCSLALKHAMMFLLERTSLMWPHTTLGAAAIWLSVYKLGQDLGGWATFLRGFRQHGLDTKAVDLACREFTRSIGISAARENDTNGLPQTTILRRPRSDEIIAPKKCPDLCRDQRSMTPVMYNSE